METLTEGYGLIEGPVWVAGRGLLFSDVTFGGVFCLADDGLVSEVFPHRKGIGGMAEHVDGGMVISDATIVRCHEPLASCQGCTAPSSSDSDGSGTMRSGSTDWRLPRPLQDGQAP